MRIRDWFAALFFFFGLFCVWKIWSREETARRMPCGIMMAMETASDGQWLSRPLPRNTRIGNSTSRLGLHGPGTRLPESCTGGLLAVCTIIIIRHFAAKGVVIIVIGSLDLVRSLSWTSIPISRKCLSNASIKFCLIVVCQSRFQSCEAEAPVTFGFKLCLR